MREREKEEDHVRGPEEVVWGDGERGEVPPPEESGGDDDAGGDTGGKDKGKRERGGGGGGGGGKKATRGKKKPATAAAAAAAATAATACFTSSYRGVLCLPRGARRWKAQLEHSGIQSYLGHFDAEEGAARAYDRMAVWFKVRGVKRKGGTKLNFDYAEYEGELEELGRMTQTEVVAKLRLQARAQLGAHREAANDAEEHEAAAGAGGNIGGAELGVTVYDEGGGESVGEGDGHSLDDGASAPHPNAIHRWS